MRLFPKNPPPGPSEEPFWQSPIRGPWMTAALGSLMLPFFLLVGFTGFMSHAAYNPNLGQNQVVPRDGDLDLLLFDWPTGPSWLFALNQGLHTIVGICVVPLILAKLWSVFPKLFAWPPIKSPAQALERISLLLLVGGAGVLWATGLTLALQLRRRALLRRLGVPHRALHPHRDEVHEHPPRLRRARRAQAAHGRHRAHRVRAVGEGWARAGGPRGRVDLAPRRPRPDRRDVRVALRRHRGAVHRRAAALRRAARAARAGRRARGLPDQQDGSGRRDQAGMVGPSYRLTLGGRSFTRAQIAALPQRTEKLPIACVEGWSVRRTWTGVQLRDLAAMAGLRDGQGFQVISLQERGAFRQTTLSHDQVMNGGSLLALRVDGEDLSMDHGYPARIIVPALPGVHNTKWVTELKVVNL